MSSDEVLEELAGIINYMRSVINDIEEGTGTFREGYSWAEYHVTEIFVMMNDDFVCECETPVPELTGNGWVCGDCETLMIDRGSELEDYLLGEEDEEEVDLT